MDTKRIRQILAFLSAVSVFVFFNSKYGNLSRQYVGRMGPVLKDLPFQMDDIETGAADPLAVRSHNIQILSWVSKSKERDEPWWPDGDAVFKDCEKYLDPGQSCSYTHNQDDYNDSDAVLFRGRRLWENFTLPMYRLPRQKWIFYEYEPPYKVYDLFKLEETRYAFNLTSTYTFDCDIPLTTPRKYYPRNHFPYKDYAKNKTRLVAWFVSVCRSQSKREKYVDELSKYIPIDIYGGCGTLECGGRNTKARNQCSENLLNNVYKFYLAFENSLCRDYVTEKLFKNKGYDVISVVMGAVDYANIMPPGTFIDVKDYPDPKDLARYLKYLDRHDDVYNDMLNTKRELKPVFSDYTPYECRLCKYLHDNYKKKERVFDVARYWSLENQCISQEEYFRK